MDAKSQSLGELLASRADEIAQREFLLGDTLDIKTSIVLAVLVFLAVQTQDLLRSPLLHGVAMLQYVSVLALAAGGVFSIVALWPRDYGAERSFAEYDAWVRTLRDNHAKDENPEGAVLAVVVAGREKKARQRAEKYVGFNNQKSLFLRLAFYGTGISLMCNLLTLASHLF